MIVGANVATIVLMLLVGYSDRLDPTVHPILSCLGLIFPVFLLLNLCFLIFWALFSRPASRLERRAESLASPRDEA